MRENTFITEDSYNKLKSNGIELKKKLTKSGFNEEEIKALKFDGQILRRVEALHGSSYAHFSSFQYYHENKDSKIGEMTKDRTNTDDISVSMKSDKKNWYNIDKLQDWNKIKDPTLRAGYVFIGANAGTGAKGLSFEHFENFHNFGSAIIGNYYNSFIDDVDFYVDIKDEEIDKHLLEEYELRKKEKVTGYIRYDKIKKKKSIISDIDFLEENIKGSYATDLVKGLPTTDSGKLKKHFRDTAKALYNTNVDSEIGNIYKKEFRNVTTYINDFKKRLAYAFVDILIEELDLLGSITHTLIVMNSPKDPLDSFIIEMLKLGKFEEKYKNKDGIPINIKMINHYTYTNAPYIRRYQLEEVFEKEDKSSKRIETWIDKVKNDSRFKGVGFRIKKMKRNGYYYDEWIV